MHNKGKRINSYLFQLSKYALFSILAIGCGLIHAETDGFFNDAIHRVEVTFDSGDFWLELEVTHETEEYITCDVIIDDTASFENVGIRLKGNSSYGHPGRKKPFIIKFDEFEDENYLGFDRLNFSNGFKDPTLLREKLACDLFNKWDVPCPRTTFAEVYYNDDYWGLYTIIEPVNNDFLDSRFSENDGNLYKGDPRGQLVWRGSSPDNYRMDYEKDTNIAEDDWTDLIAFIDFLNNSSIAEFQENFADTFILSVWMRFYAINTMLVNLDSYIHTGHNYYFYFTADGKGNYIVWDVNEAFANFSADFNAAELRTLPLDYYESPRPLAERPFFDIPDFRPAVESIVWQLIENDLSDDVFTARVDELANIIRFYVYADTMKMFSDSEFETNLYFDLSGLMGMPVVGLTSFIHDRAEHMRSTLPPYTAPTDIYQTAFINEIMASNDSTIADEYGEYDDWVELYNPADTTIDLSGFYLTDDIDNTHKFEFPDGAIIAARGYLLIWCDNDIEQEPLHANFKLSASEGEFVGLYAPDIYENQLIDSMSFDPLETDESFGRQFDGDPAWGIQDSPTPLAANIGWAAINNNSSIQPEALNISVYPNPFNSTIRCQVSGNRCQVSGIEIFDLRGKLVRLFGAPITDNRLPITEFIWQPAQSIGSGVYIIRVSIDDETLTRRIVYLK